MAKEKKKTEDELVDDIFDIQAEFLEQRNVKVSLRKTLQKVGQLVSADAISYHGLCENVMYEVVCWPGCKENTDIIRSQFYSILDSTSKEKLKKGQTLYGLDKVNNSALIKLFEDQGIKAIMIVPLISKSLLQGVILIERLNGTKDWTALEKKLIRISSRTISNSIGFYNEFRVLNEELKIRARDTNYRDQLNASANHEIRSTLQSIISTAVLFERDQNAEFNHLIDSLKSSSEYLLELVTELLHYSKSDYSELAIKKESFILNDFLNRISKPFIISASKKKLDFELIIGPDLPKIVIGDPFRLTQVISNLIYNSVKFTDQGYVKLEVNLVKYEGEKVVIDFVITDTGKGISQSELPQLFAPFVQGDKSDSKGFGLGLFIVKNLIEKLGGRVYVDNKIKGRTKFICTLPFTYDGVAIRSNELKLDKYEALKIMMVDDHEVSHVIFKTLIEKSQIQLKSFTGAAKAYEYLQHERIDLLICDLRVPVMDGIELSKKIRLSNDFFVASTPIAFFTAHLSEEERMELERLGVYHVFLKPITKQIVFNLFDGFGNDLVPATYNINLIVYSWLKTTRSDVYSTIMKHLMADLEELGRSVLQYQRNHSPNKLKSVIHKIQPILKQIEFDELHDLIKECADSDLEMNVVKRHQASMLKCIRYGIDFVENEYRNSKT